MNKLLLIIGLLISMNSFADRSDGYRGGYGYQGGGYSEPRGQWGGNYGGGYDRGQWDNGYRGNGYDGYRPHHHHRHHHPRPPQPIYYMQPQMMRPMPPPQFNIVVPLPFPRW